VEKRSVVLGEKFRISAEVKPGKKISASLTEKSDSVAVVSASGSQDKLRSVIDFVALKSGEIEIPDIELKVDGKIFTVKSFKVSVSQNTTEQDMNLRDIKEPVKIMEKDYTLLYVLGVAAGLIALILLIIFLIKKFKKEPVEVPVIVTSVDIANKYLKLARSAKSEGDFESYVDHLTVGIRAYMSHKSEINYAEMTTSEVRRKLRKDKHFKKFDEKIIGLLKLGDRFKFADEMLKEKDFDELYSGFKEIVDEVS
jgi:hypothetical protein